MDAQKLAEDFAQFMIENGAKIDEKNKKNIYYHDGNKFQEGSIKKHLQRYIKLNKNEIKTTSH